MIQRSAKVPVLRCLGAAGSIYGKSDDSLGGFTDALAALAKSEKRAEEALR
jgi:hypothetical protein